MSNNACSPPVIRCLTKRSSFSPFHRHLCRAAAGPSSDPPIELLFVTRSVVVPNDVRAKHMFVASPAAMRRLAGLQVLSGAKLFELAL